MAVLIRVSSLTDKCHYVAALNAMLHRNMGHEVHILHIDIELCFVLIVIIGLSPNSVSQLYCSKDNYKQKQRNTLPVTMITKIMHFNRLLWWLSLWCYANANASNDICSYEIVSWRMTRLEVDHCYPSLACNHNKLVCSVFLVSNQIRMNARWVGQSYYSYVMSRRHVSVLAYNTIITSFSALSSRTLRNANTSTSVSLK